MKQIQLNIDAMEGTRPAVVRRMTAKALGTKASLLGPTCLRQQALDVRGKYPVYHCVVDVYELSEQPPVFTPLWRDAREDKRVIVVGTGPAGMFAALTLLEAGFKPIMLERGKDIHQRKIDVAQANKGIGVNPDSNFCFGEGGAGTFSDGKLYTRSTKRGDVGRVLQYMVAHGAPEEILSQAHAHLGSDRLPALVERIRQTIIQYGGEYHFETRVTDLLVRDGRVYGVCDAQGVKWEGLAVVLATGHSATDLYELFYNRGWAIEQKGFALGVRVEHPQAMIDDIQYHRVARSHRPYMPPAAYNVNTQAMDRGVFSFCMCPGGMIVPSATNEQGLALNGMSNARRNGAFANAGIVVQVNPADFAADPASFYATDLDPAHPLAMLRWQQQMEQAARVGGPSAPLLAPAQRMTDFAKKMISASLPESTYRPGCLEAPLHALLPPFIAKRLRLAFPQFDRLMHGFFSQEALLLGVESRTSSPVRLPRQKDTLEHVSLAGLYPCGEGAGYAGGIISSAVDGVNCAKQIIAIFAQ